MKLPEKDDPFRSLSPEDLAKIEPLPIEVIEAALEQGRRARQAVIDSHVVPFIPSGLRFR